MRRLLWLLIGMLLGALLVRPTLAQNAILAAASFNGAVKVLTADTNGYLYVVTH